MGSETTKEGVFRATVSYSVEGFAQGVTSDDEGHFEITVPQGIDSLRVSHISFNPTMKSIKFVKTKSIKIALSNAEALSQCSNQEFEQHSPTASTLYHI